MKKVLITGASGLVGSRVIELLKTNYQWLSPSSKELNITDQQSVTDYLNSHQFDICLHLAGYTNVDKAEIEKDICYQINVLGTRYLFQKISQKNIPFILISTDFVFNGAESQHNERSNPEPLGYYGQTKYQAEQLVKNQAMIIRLSYPYGLSSAPKLDFVRTILKILKAGENIQGITDLIITPTFLDDIAIGFKYLIDHFQPKIYHLSGPDYLSPYQAAIKIAQVFNLDQNLIKPTTSLQYFSQKAKRPKNNKITSLYQLWPTHTFEQGLLLVKEHLS